MSDITFNVEENDKSLITFDIDTTAVVSSEESEEESDEEEDEDFNCEDLVENIMETFETNSLKKEISWDIDIGELPTYLHSEKKINFGIAQGKWDLTPMNLIKEEERINAKNERAFQQGNAVSSLDDYNERQKNISNKKKNYLEKYGNLPKQELTPELRKELEILRMRAYADPKRRYKTNDSNKLPTHFHIGVEVGGGLKAVGVNTNLVDSMNINNNKKLKGQSFMNSILKDQKVKDHCVNRLQSTHNRVHVFAKKKKTKPTSKHAWRKKKK